MKTINLPCYGIKIGLLPDGGGSITDDLHEEIHPDCIQTTDIIEMENWNNMVDGITSLILAHACAGIDVESPAYIEGIETAIQACEQYA
jgi:CheY-specific phosphatase CheX